MLWHQNVLLGLSQRVELHDDVVLGSVSRAARDVGETGRVGHVGVYEWHFGIGLLDRGLRIAVILRHFWRQGVSELAFANWL